jgi:hypothetical protein
MEAKARVTRETYKGRKLLVKRNPREWGTLVSFVNGEPLGTPYGGTQADVEREMASLRGWVDAADERRITEPDAYPAHWYIGAPEPTAEEVATAHARAARERADREALAT